MSSFDSSPNQGSTDPPRKRTKWINKPDKQEAQKKEKPQRQGLEQQISKSILEAEQLLKLIQQKPVQPKRDRSEYRKLLDERKKSQAKQFQQANKIQTITIFKNNTQAMRYKSFHTIQKESFILTPELKKIKQIFQTRMKNIQNAKVCASKQYPTFFFLYEDTGEKISLKMMTIGEAFRKLRAFKKEIVAIRNIFKQLFKVVPIEFIKISEFAVLKGKEQNINLDFIEKDQSQIQSMLYYLKQEDGNLSFTFSHRTMIQIQFGESYISYKKTVLPRIWKIFTNFKESLMQTSTRRQKSTSFNNPDDRQKFNQPFWHIDISNEYSISKQRPMGKRKQYVEVKQVPTKKQYVEVKPSQLMRKEQRSSDSKIQYRARSKINKYIIKQEEPVSNEKKEQSLLPTNFMEKRQKLKNINKKSLQNIGNNDEGYSLQNERQISINLNEMKQAVQANIRGKEVKIFASSILPMIYFMINHRGFSNFLHLKEVIKDIQKSKNYSKNLQKIFNYSYDKVPQKYAFIAVFGCQMAKKNKLKFTKETIFNQNKETHFYYKQTDNNCHFTLFNCYWDLIEFNNDIIRGYSHLHPDEYQLFLKFIQFNNTGNQPILDSQADIHIFQQETITSIEAKIYKILDRNLDYFKQKIEAQRQDLQEEARFNRASYKYKWLDDTIKEAEGNIAIFEDVRELMADQIQDLRPQQRSKILFKSILKKMIIAQKQLDSRLPIITKKKIITKHLSENNLLILQGETGSGKSTQLPQILCEHYGLFDSHSQRAILITQPRRLAVRTVAERVAIEIDEKIGQFVDYQLTAANPVNKSARIIFKLDRLALDEIIQDPLLSNYSCLVIDQAHQRTISIDVIMGLVKQLLRKRKDFKVIITSASMEIEVMQNYFGQSAIKISGRAHHVNTFYHQVPKINIGDRYYTINNIMKFINEQILPYRKPKRNITGHILCFCSGIQEINYLSRQYSKKLDPNQFSVFALHGIIQPQQQKEIFRQTHKIKLIFANRIAETAVTINGIQVVIDPGYDLQNVYDQQLKVTSRRLLRVSQSSAKQRAGRAGRTELGLCYRLYSESEFRKFRVNKRPQIQNSSLDSVVLRLKSLNIKNVLQFPFIANPSQQGLKKSQQLLVLLGALQPNTHLITNIGKLLCKLPVQPFLARAIAEALILENLYKKSPAYQLNISPQNRETFDRKGLFTSVVEILSMVVNSSQLFYNKSEDREDICRAKYEEFNDDEGDFFFLHNIYSDYKRVKLMNNDYKLKEWAKKYYLNLKTLSQTAQQITEINNILRNFINVEDQLSHSQLLFCKQKLKKSSYREIVLSCIVASFCSNLSKFSGNPNVGYTVISQRRPVRLHPSSILSIQGKDSQWMICYDFAENMNGKVECKIAQSVTFEFLKKHISQTIWNTYDISSIEANNAFYLDINKQMPTVMVRFYNEQVNSMSNQNEVTKFLRECNTVINFYNNSVTFYVENYDIRKNRQTRDKIQRRHRIQEQKLKMPYRHNYIGHSYAMFEDGLKIKKIQISEDEYRVEIKVRINQMDTFKQTLQKYGSYSCKESQQQIMKKKPYDLVKLIIVIGDIDLRDDLEEELNQMKRYRLHIQWRVFIQKKMKKNNIPKTCVLLKFFTCRAVQNTVFLHYGDQIVTQNSFEEIKSAIKNKNFTHSLKHKINLQRIHLSKGKKGINIFESNLDEFQIEDILQQMQSQKLVSAQFRLPKDINKFRQPPRQIYEDYSRKQNDYWRTKILSLLNKKESQANNIDINIIPVFLKQRDSFRRSQKVRVQITAELRTYSDELYEMLHRKYHGKENILGCQKLHIFKQYQAYAIELRKGVFDNLYQNYQYAKKTILRQLPLLKLYNSYKKIGKVQFIKVLLCSKKREDLNIATEKLQAAFSYKLIRVNQQELYFLQKTEEGDEMLENIQRFFKNHYGWQIFIGFKAQLFSLQVYSDPAYLQEIVQQIMFRIQRIRSSTIRISYAGKNLIKIEDILEKKQHTLNRKDFGYNFDYQKKEVILTTDLKTSQKIADEIGLLGIENIRECSICNSLMRKPFKLFNCHCQYCTICITKYVQKNTVRQLILCPQDECRKPINVNDIKQLLSQEQFIQKCNRRIAYLVRSNPNQYSFCKHCDYIFGANEILKNNQQQQLICQLCGKRFCWQCQDSHQQNTTCQEWQDKLLEERGLINQREHDIKYCDKCGEGITKDKNVCNHLVCLCGAHICWLCREYYDSKQQCLRHIKDEHRNILFGKLSDF